MSTLNSISRSLSSLSSPRWYSAGVYEEGVCGRRRKARPLNKTRANRLIRSLARANLVLDIIIFIWARHRAPSAYGNLNHARSRRNAPLLPRFLAGLPIHASLCTVLMKNAASQLVLVLTAYRVTVYTARRSLLSLHRGKEMFMNVVHELVDE